LNKVFRLDKSAYY